MAFSQTIRRARLPKTARCFIKAEIPAMGFYTKSGIVKIFNITSQGEEKDRRLRKQWRIDADGLVV